MPKRRLKHLTEIAVPRQIPRQNLMEHETTISAIELTHLPTGCFADKDTMHNCTTRMAEPSVKPYIANHRRDQAKQPMNQA